MSTPTVQEHKESMVVASWKELLSSKATQQKAVAYLKDLPSDCSQLFFSFLETFAKGVRRDHQPTPHSFTVLDGSLLRCNQKIINAFMAKGLEKAFDSKAANSREVNEFGCVLKMRLFGTPDLKEGNPTDVLSLLQYQKDRIHPSTFKPLDYFSQKDETQGFIAIQLQMQMGDAPVVAAEYLSPYRRSPTWQESASALVQNEPTVQIRRMDKQYIGASLAHIAAIFERIVKPAKSYTPQALKKDLAELVYKWTFISPFVEESGEFADFLQTTLASLHGYQLTVKDQAKIHHKAISTPYFPAFLKRYNQIVHLKG